MFFNKLYEASILYKFSNIIVPKCILINLLLYTVKYSNAWQPETSNSCNLLLNASTFFTDLGSIKLSNSLSEASISSNCDELPKFKNFNLFFCTYT